MTDEPVPVAAAPRRVSLYNPANLLTAIRLVLVPVFVVFVVASEMTEPGWRMAACLVFCVASATDFVDGWIARRFHLVTSFGKVADPIADKALTGTALVLLSAYDRLSWWVTVLILLREWGVTALRLWVIRYGVIPASRGGKVKTVLQIAAIAWYLWPMPEPLERVGPWLMAAAVVVTLVTGVDYVVRALRLRRAAGAGTVAGG
ncbi:CDP-diacylglycerol--glycerol-3-phosphate 3-phosphatidyltransferase [Krasilnikovia sp. MM14-A1259]|uniref:CDP-diacylglycerol--glycerol-3-phosphate 3-phosphatidyltransferase n=1 Tax=Krasilnikovia sp. MM14-A1259 TaxID=3373539 RepID=UPI00382312FF